MFDIGQFDAPTIFFVNKVNFLNNKNYIGMEIHALANLIMRYMDNNGHRRLVDSVTGTNGWILGFIAFSEAEGRDVFQRDLEEKFGVTRSTVSKVVNLMVQKGLIVRSPVVHDARLKKLTLTAKSRELMQFMREDDEMMENIITDGFSEAEKAQIFEYVRRMKENVLNKFNAESGNGKGICPFAELREEE